jgi:hypothetical protein
MLIKNMSCRLTSEALKIIDDISTVSDRLSVCSALETTYENTTYELPRVSGSTYPKSVLIVYCVVDNDEPRAQIFYMYDKIYEFVKCIVNPKMIATQT